ncbi:MAG: hypothetical protein EA001_01800 [Oscillatoriales cyanobacterium]|nr:MAG: hypothetical protein EA001_01800 [Oscillatoriales cyanobacterium]
MPTAQNQRDRQESPRIAKNRQERMDAPQQWERISKNRQDKDGCTPTVGADKLEVNDGETLTLIWWADFPNAPSTQRG